MSEVIYDFESNPKAQRGAPKNAMQVAAVLETISRKNKGELTPEAVIAHAENPRSPLHKHFEWDDTEAARKWRIVQARGLIASVRVNIVGVEDAAPVRCFVNVTQGKNNSYMNAKAAMEDPDIRAAVLRRALADLKSAQNRYQELEELADVWAALSKVAV